MSEPDLSEQVGDAVARAMRERASQRESPDKRPNISLTPDELRTALESAEREEFEQWKRDKPIRKAWLWIGFILIILLLVHQCYDAGPLWSSEDVPESLDHDTRGY